MARRTGMHTTQMSDAEYELLVAGLEGPSVPTLEAARERWPGATIMQLGQRNAFVKMISPFAADIAVQVEWNVYPPECEG